MPTVPVFTSRAAHRWAKSGVIAGTCLLLAILAVSYLRLPAEPGTPVEEERFSLDWAEPVPVPEGAWAAMRAAGGVEHPGQGAASQRLRLAGIFFELSPEGQGGSDAARRAILDDLAEGSQHLMTEGDRVAGYTLHEIQADRVLLRRNGAEEELRLNFADAASAPGTSAAAGKPAANGEVVLETNRFGKRVGPRRWVFDPQALRDYYEEVLHDPERLAALYLSMKPDYQDQEIGGYYLDVEGERDFFDAVGLKEGDIVRRVNSMKMTSQPRAEYFLKEFIQNRLGAVVLDIERDGHPEKLIFLLEDGAE